MPQAQSHTRLRTEPPRMFNVIMLNDDFTTMDFVVKMLRTVFFKPLDSATTLMLKVHHEGQAVIGTYTYDIAVSKANKAMQMARDEGYPFKLTVEPVEEELPF